MFTCCRDLRYPRTLGLLCRLRGRSVGIDHLYLPVEDGSSDGYQRPYGYVSGKSACLRELHEAAALGRSLSGTLELERRALDVTLYGAALGDYHEVIGIDVALKVSVYAYGLFGPDVSLELGLSADDCFYYL